MLFPFQEFYSGQQHGNLDNHTFQETQLLGILILTQEKWTWSCEVLKQVDNWSNFHHGERVKLTLHVLVLCRSKIERLWVVCLFIPWWKLCHWWKMVELINKWLEQEAFIDSVRVKRADFAITWSIVVSDGHFDNLSWSHLQYIRVRVCCLSSKPVDHNNYYCYTMNLH